MHVFITEIIKEDGKYEGPKINALSWEEAEIFAEQQDVTLVGMLN
ncbi:hypothetical protein [Desulfobacterium sp. N47]|jgi:hypothetical protein|uniref:Uncharacterized protein n=1 Tax=uncultured Desulfobacterium sp. TaxID=201089 RepID=E1YC16_9BACT|nr:unknown protein [uncultured Desulfobacterium sp.]